MWSQLHQIPFCGIWKPHSSRKTDPPFSSSLTSLPPFANGLCLFFSFSVYLEAAVLVFNQCKVIEYPHVHRPGEMSHSFPGGSKKTLLFPILQTYWGFWSRKKNTTLLSPLFTKRGLVKLNCGRPKLTFLCDTTDELGRNWESKVQTCLQPTFRSGNLFHCVLMEFGCAVFSLGIMQVNKKQYLCGRGGQDQDGGVGGPWAHLLSWTHHSYNYIQSNLAENHLKTSSAALLRPKPWRKTHMEPRRRGREAI